MNRTIQKSSVERLTAGPADLIIPADGGAFRYGNGFPFQAEPGKAGLFVNIRFGGFPVGDFEAGMDVVLFDDPANISSEGAVQITRTEKYTHPETGKPRIIIKHSQKGGFVPLGARRADGSPHPAAGTGFLLGEACDFPMIGNGYYRKEDKTRDMVRRKEVNHLAYDGTEFRLLKRETIPGQTALRAPGSDWKFLGPGMRNAIPDGDDLLFAIDATRGDASTIWPQPSASGVSRWRYIDGSWQPVEFVPVVTSREVEDPRVIYGQETHARAFEPSIARDVDGSLVFTARTSGTDAEDHMIRAWRSTDGGSSWELLFEEPQTRGQSPITINSAADGTPYIISCKPGHERDWLLLWPLKDDRSGLEEPMTVRNGLEDFGPPPSGIVWFMDHPNATTVHLADGKWHNLLSHRVMDRGEHSGQDPAPQTGHYVEEVFSSGAVVPVWNFG